MTILNQQGSEVNMRMTVAEHKEVAALLSEAADNLWCVANQLDGGLGPDHEAWEQADDLVPPVDALRRRLREMYEQQFPTATDNPYVDEDGV